MLRKDFYLKLKGYSHEFSVRGNRSDPLVFLQIFVEQEYDIALEHIVAPTIIDAGANVGYTSIYLANRYPNARIIALEPEKENFDQLIENTVKYENIHAMNCALWSKQATLSIENGGTGDWGFTVVEKESCEGDSISAIDVSTLMSNFNVAKIDLLKVDIEGSEKVVFSFSAGWIDSIDRIIIESHDGLIEGSTKTFFKSIEHRNYTMETTGECVFVEFMK